MEKRTFTDKSLQALKPKKTPYKQTEHAPKGEGRLMVRVLPSGVKECFYRYRVNGGDKLLALGRYDQRGTNGKTLADIRAAYRDKRKTVFFDAETCPAVACTGFGPGDSGRIAPEGLAAAFRYQALHLIPGNGYSMISVATDNAINVPRHRQDADKIIYVLSGEMRLGEGMPALRPGAGISVPAWTPLEISIGAAGVKYLEYRKQSGWHTDW